MNRLSQIILCVSFVGALTIGWFLLTGHAGIAIRFSNYLYFSFIFGLVLKTFSNE